MIFGFSKRKWGFYWVIWRWPGLKVKLLYFKPGHSISMQRHFERTEEWRILLGNGTMEYGWNKDKLHSEALSRHGEIVHLMENVWHRFTAGPRTLVLEIQRGKCRESDIERA